MRRTGVLAQARYPRVRLVVLDRHRAQCHLQRDRETERERESERLSLFVYRHGRTWSNAKHVMTVPVMACASASKGTGVNKTAVITCGHPHHTEREGGRERERGREGEREGGREREREGGRERYTQTDRQTDRHRPIPRRIICCVNE
jgi:hypothetical protein